MKKEFTAEQTKILQTLEELTLRRDNFLNELRRDFPGVNIRVSFYDVPVEQLPPIFTADILGDEYLITTMGALSAEPNLQRQRCYFTFAEVKNM